LSNYNTVNPKKTREERSSRVQEHTKRPGTLIREVAAVDAQTIKEGVPELFSIKSKGFYWVTKHNNELQYLKYTGLDDDLATKSYIKDLSHVENTAATYAGDPTGAVGSAATAATLLTRNLPANSLTSVGDRIRIRTWLFITGGAALTITTALNGVTISDIVHTGAGQFDLTEAWLHYVDDTTFHLIEQETGTGLGALTAVNVGGSNWDASQDITVAQNSAAGSYATVWGLFVDIFPNKD